MDHMTDNWLVQGTVVTVNKGWRKTTPIPTFFLNSAWQGITDAAHAERIARSVVGIGLAPSAIVHLTVEPAEGIEEFDFLCTATGGVDRYVIRKNGETLYTIPMGAVPREDNPSGPDWIARGVDEGTDKWRALLWWALCAGRVRRGV